LRPKSRGRSRPTIVGRTDDSRRARAAGSPGGGAAACQRRCSACLARWRPALGISALAYSRHASRKAAPAPLARRGRPRQPKTSESPPKRAPGSTRRCGRNPPGVPRVPSGSAPGKRPVAYRGFSVPAYQLMAVFASLKARARGVERDVLAALEPSGHCNGRRRARFGCDRSNDGSPTLIQAVNQRRPHSLRSRTDVKVTESFRASRDCPGRAFHSPLSNETGPPPPQRAAF